MRSSIENLSADGISSPDFNVVGPRSAKKWASGASEKLYKNIKHALEEDLENLPRLECKYANARILSCGGTGAQWLAQAPTCHLTQLNDDDMRTVIRFRLGKETFCADVCPHINQLPPVNWKQQTEMLMVFHAVSSVIERDDIC